MPLQATSGAASYDAFGGGVPVVPQYIEDVFNSYLWTTSGSDQTFTTGIDMTKGALTWIKGRSNAYPHILQTGIGGGVLPDNALSTNSTAAYAGGNYRIAESTTGFTMGTDYYTGTPQTAVVWTFRKQPKFFDVVTWSGNGTIGRTISHSLGSVPGCIIVKKTNSAGASDWVVYHRSLGATKAMLLNLTDSVYTWNVWNDTAPTSTVFSLNDASEVNGAGNSYVAYVFAHDAGGFGLTGSDNVISCGSYTEGASATTVTLGYEPQWILLKRSSGSSSWYLHDTMRGMSQTNLAYLQANSSAAESDFGAGYIKPTATGFIAEPGYFGSGSTVIYIAIRRGPMKVPTSGTSVYQANTYTGNGTANTTVAGNFGFPVDLLSLSSRSATALDWVNYAHFMIDRLRGQNVTLSTASTNSDVTGWQTYNAFDVQNSIGWGLYGAASSSGYMNNSGGTFIARGFRRAPSFFDEVCYTGTGSANTAFTHNLTVTPELMIVKPRSAATAPNWRVWSPINSTDFNLLQLSTNGAASSSLYSSSNVFPAIPTATTFTVGGSGSIQLNESGQTFVAYLFATCAGVSKVGSFTGNGSSQTINCGFTGGARFVMVKATSTTGDWMVADSARGIVSGSDPYLELNNTNAEVTGEDWLDTDSTGFVVNEVSGSNANTNGVTYIFLAIA